MNIKYFNNKRRKLVVLLEDEYETEEAIEQIANANVINIKGNIYTVIYENGKSDRVEILKDKAVLKNY